MIKFTLRPIDLNKLSLPSAEVKADFEALVVNIFEGEEITPNFHGLDKETISLVKRLQESKDLKTDKNKSRGLFPLANYPFRLLIVGSGKKEEFNANTLRENAGATIKALKKRHPKKVAFDFNFKPEPELIRAMVEGIVLASFDHDIFKTTKEENVKLEEVVINIKSTTALEEAVKAGQFVGETINRSRDLEFQPANLLTPSVLVDEAKQIAKDYNLSLKVYDEAEAKKMGMGGFTAIAQGSDQPSFMVVLSYWGNKRSKEAVGLVGKGITFDSGGISIKPSRGMHEMKMDMCGAANVLAMMRIIAHEALPINVVAAMPITENMPSGKATKPGDVVTALNGKTIEITNTDAEGRVVMSDALVLVQREGATKIMEFSTLTGAVLVALGDITTAVLGKDQDFIDQILATAKKEDEPMWQLPADERYKDLLKSHIADMVNAEGGGKIKGAGTIAGAMFLLEFIEKGNQFAHFDIAGTAWGSGNAYLAHGPTGVGIRTAVSVIKSLAKPSKK